MNREGQGEISALFLRAWIFRFRPSRGREPQQQLPLSPLQSQLGSFPVIQP
jgi:hypothetical protein